MEEFSQSRADDDLFDDEIVPVPPSQQSTTQPVPQTKPVSQPDTARNGTPSQPRDRGRGRGGIPRGGSKRNDLNQSKYAPTPPESAPAPVPTAVPDTTATEQSTPQDTPQASTEPPTSRPVPAVKGDRLSTGGIRKPKLTESELTAKLAEAKQRSQNLSAAHARAQADAADFEERERVARDKRAKEVVARKVMEGEREKNRVRKLRGGREWDLNKEEQEQRPYQHQDVGGDDLSQYTWHENRGRGRGRGSGRGRGRGTAPGPPGTGRGANPNSKRMEDINAAVDFPALPVARPAPTPPPTATPTAATTAPPTAPTSSASKTKETSAGNVLSPSSQPLLEIAPTAKSKKPPAPTAGIGGGGLGASSWADESSAAAGTT